MILPNYTTVSFCMNNYAKSIVLAEHPKTTFFRLFLENAKFKSRKNLDRKLNNFATNNFSSFFTWYIQIFRPMASFRELSCTSRPWLLYIVDTNSDKLRPSPPTQFQTTEPTSNSKKLRHPHFLQKNSFVTAKTKKCGFVTANTKKYGKNTYFRIWFVHCHLNHCDTLRAQSSHKYSLSLTPKNDFFSTFFRKCQI